VVHQRTSTRSDDIDAFISASRTLVALAVASLAEVEDDLSLAQFRALVVLGDAGTMKAAELADRLGTSASSVTRMCDRLVADRLLTRVENPANRREVLLTATASGGRLVERVLSRRRLGVQRILDRLTDEERVTVVRAFEVFAAHADPVIDTQVVHEWPAS
jgi:DNA-binding MarR family transcriptional regulator